MALCRSHPTRGKVLQSSPLARAVNVVRLASKGSKRRRHLSDPLKPAPAATREKGSFQFCVVPRVPLRAERAFTHLSRGGDPHTPLPRSAWL